MSHPPTRIGLIGAGYIASWHADALSATPGVQITAVCDRAADAAGALAEALGCPVFGSVEALIEAKTCDAVHVLTPPDTHKALAIQCLEGGLDVLVEKPVALSAQETREIAETATRHGRRFHAGHNFLGLPSYARLKQAVAQGRLGRISAARIDWCLPLAPLRSGPYGLWLLRAPENLLKELGPHPYSFAVDLFGPLEILSAQTGQPVTLPGGETRDQSWRILARAGDIDVTFTLSMVETVDSRSVTLRGSSGMARLDYGADTAVMSGDNTADLVLNPLKKELALAGAHLREGLRNAVTQMASLNRKSPYGQSFRGMARAVYGGDSGRYGPEAAIAVMQAIDDTLAKCAFPPAPARVAGTPRPSVMVIGGTGYIGRALTRALVAKGHDVRVLSRGAHGPFADIADHVETVPVSLRDKAGIAAAMAGIDTVYNLAKSMDTTWEEALENDVGTARRIAEAAQAAGVRRLIYTGTIASYDMSDPRAVITEETSFGEIAQRNLYARSKAECERRLMAMHRETGLPLVIARPGIVVGGDGPLQHWGIGRWHGAGAVKLWGGGRNILPFVLVEDLCAALIAMMDRDGVVGQSFNLTGAPMLTGRAYFDAIHDRLGARLRVTSGNLTAMWMADAVKYALKRHALGRKSAVRASLADWRSRGHFARFDNAKARRVLGWQPEDNRDAFLAKALDARALFGL
ncbi:MAG: NAD-dependent epimerase/dehydratase family protein [Nioella sp.]